MDIDDIFSEPAAPIVRAGGRFLPRAKQQPKKQASASTTSAPPNNTKEKAVVQSPSSMDELQIVKPVEIVHNSSRDPKDALPSEVAVSDSNENNNSIFGMLTKDNADIFSGLEFLDDFLSQPSGGTVSAMDKPHEVPMHNPPENELLASCSVDTDTADFPSATESQALHACSNKELEKNLSDTGELSACPDYTVNQDPVTWRDTEISDNNGDIHSENRMLQNEEAGAFDLETLDIVPEAAITGRRTGKYQPKPKLKSKVQTGEEKPGANCSHVDAVSETECIHEGSVPSFPSDDILDYSSLSFGGPIDPEPSTSEFPVNEELTEKSYHPGAAMSGDLVHSEDGLEVPEELGSKSKKRKASSVSDISQRSGKHSTTGEQNINGKSWRQLGKGLAAPELVDEPEDHDESPNNSDMDGDEDNELGHTVKRNSRKKGGGESKRPVAAKEKLVRKRKKANEAPDQSTKEPPKKFSHSTRRKKRWVDKDLLETPEEEIRYLPIKDMILVADYKERIAKKEAKTTMPSTDRSENTSNHDDSRNEEWTFVSESTDDRASFGFQSSSFVLNYQSYMKKEPRSRWSKQDTQLFYEAVQQFGSDLSMIQQLFPDKSRHQIKLKYKKEERQHPLRLLEALANRSKDHSHFEKVIERLQKVAAEAAGESNEDESVCVSVEDVEGLTFETKSEEVGKSELRENIIAGVEEANYAEVDSAGNADANEEEADDDADDIWSSYKSEF